MCWGITCDIALEGRWRRSRANTTPLPDTGVPKTQTTSVKMGEFGVFCTRWSAFWVPRPSGRPLDGGNCTTRGYDTPATHRLRASCSAKPPLLPVWRAAEGVAARRAQGGVGVRRAWLRCLWAVAGPGPDKFRMQFPHGTIQHKPKNRRISTIRFQNLKYFQGNCMRNYRDAVRTQHHTATRPRSLGSSGGSEGLAAVPVGGGGAWPGFEATRRAKLAARTTRGRAAAHGHIKQPGTHTTQPGPSSPAHTQPGTHTAHTAHTARGPKRRSASGPSRVSVAHRLSWMLRPGTASISSRV